MPSILITGATGTVGSELLRQLSANDIEARALVRDTAKATEQGLGDLPGVELAEGSFDDRGSLDRACEGIERVFLNSNAAEDFVELQTNVIEAAKAAGVSHVVKMAALGTSPDSPIGLARWHAEVEANLEDSGMSWTFLHPHYFMQNFVNMLPTVASINNDNAIYAPMKEGAISLVDVRDIAAVAIECLTQEGHEGQVYDLTGPEALTHTQLASHISEAAGRSIQYVDVPAEAARQGMIEQYQAPEWFANDMTTLMSVFAEGHASQVSPAIEQVTGRPAYNFESFARDHAPAWRKE